MLCRLAALMIAAPAAGTIVEHGSPGGCVAQLDRENSNYWDNTVHGQPTESFSIRVKITSHWPPFAHIKLTWVAPTEIQHVYDAEACTKGCPNLISVPTDDAATMLTAQLGPRKHETMAITIAGTGSKVPPTVLCLTESEWSKAPPPAPPHASDCVLKPEYTIRNSWDAGESVEITFGAWEESGHLLRLYYWGQTSLQIEQPVHASIHSSAPHNQGYLVELKLGESCHAECRKVAPGGDLVTAKVACRRLIAAPKALPVAALERPERGLSAESLCNHSAHLLRPGATSQPPTRVRRRRGQTARELSPTSRRATACRRRSTLASSGWSRSN
jgi:hypothetical protein